MNLICLHNRVMQHMKQQKTGIVHIKLHMIKIHQNNRRLLKLFQ